MGLPLRYNLRNLLRRSWRSSLTVAGIALSIAVAVIMLAYARGLLYSLRYDGDPDNVLVLSRKASDPEFSSIGVAELERLASEVIDEVVWYTPEPESVTLDPDDFLAGGAPVDLVAPYVSHASIVRIDGVEGGRYGERKLGLIEGVDPRRTFQMNRKLQVVAGRALDENDEAAAMVGSLAWARLGVAKEELTVGSVLEFNGVRWPVVGVFEAGGSGDEGSIWVPLDHLMTILGRTTYSCALLKLKDERACSRIIEEIGRSDTTGLRAVAETEFYRGYAESFRTFAGAGVLMALVITFGGLMIGMNTMYTAVRGRVREIGMLQVLGFSPRAILAGLLVESLLLALLGGALGCLLGGVIHGVPVKVTMGVFVMRVDAPVVAGGLLLAVAVGLLGAWLPARGVLRLPIVEAMRQV